MVLLGIPPLTSRQDLSRHRLFEPLLADLIRNLLRNLLLLLAVREDRAAVLGADIRALTVHRRRIVHTIEELEELAVCHDGGIEGDLESFGICGITREKVSNLFVHGLGAPRRRSESFGILLTAGITTAHGAVGWRRGLATTVTDLRIQKTLAVAKVLAEQVLDAPEAACGDGGFLSGGGHLARLRLRGHREDWRAG